mmetsp:Transcript_63476/g.169965  ORF Transcript_63476/g.169965 Transcript_63476/m.169965 type:complete len:418 (-) Transcript_63476:788-2041(-)
MLQQSGNSGANAVSGRRIGGGEGGSVQRSSAQKPPLRVHIRAVPRYHPYHRARIRLQAPRHCRAVHPDSFPRRRVPGHVVDVGVRGGVHGQRLPGRGVLGQVERGELRNRAGDLGAEANPKHSFRAQGGDARGHAEENTQLLLDANSSDAILTRHNSARFRLTSNPGGHRLRGRIGCDSFLRLPQLLVQPLGLFQQLVPIRHQGLRRFGLRLLRIHRLPPRHFHLEDPPLYFSQRLVKRKNLPLGLLLSRLGLQVLKSHAVDIPPGGAGLEGPLPNQLCTGWNAGLSHPHGPLEQEIIAHLPPDFVQVTVSLHSGEDQWPEAVIPWGFRIDLCGQPRPRRHEHMNGAIVATSRAIVHRRTAEHVSGVDQAVQNLRRCLQVVPLSSIHLGRRDNPVQHRNQRSPLGLNLGRLSMRSKN